MSCYGPWSGEHNNIQKDSGMSGSADLEQLFNKFF